MRAPPPAFSLHFSEIVLSCAVLSPVCHFVALSTVAHQAPLPMELSRQEYWSGLSFPPPGNLPDPGVEPTCAASQAVPTEPRGMVVVESKSQGTQGEREERNWLLTRNFPPKLSLLSGLAVRTFFFPTKEINGLFSHKNFGKTQEHLFS